MADSSEQTTRVRIKVLVNADGRYAAYGYTDADANGYDDVLYDMMSDEEITSAREFVVTAEIPTPKAVEIEASTVEAINVDAN